MKHQIPMDPEARADVGREESHTPGVHEICEDLAYKRLLMVNVVYYGTPGAGDLKWTLIDAGLPGTAGSIVSAAEERFGKGARPDAIILTHGHIDHVGALESLAERWDVPIYAHELEMPYLDGTAAYPPPDTSVGNGIMSVLSGLFPRGPIDVSRWLQPLPADGNIPGMPDWVWLHTPGHTPGHVSLWRRNDRAIVAGDAFITTNQESAYAILTQKPLMHGPPMYFTPDWESAGVSVARLAGLEPELAVTGHGPAMRGAELRKALRALACDFDCIAVPEHGRYVLNRTCVGE
jgi:glyoxylase-like metal-dependent hydrolase (beta-lactamase superfamily II)